jgi:antitoxin CptB
MSEQITDSRIRWKCRRGLLELDIVLEVFCKTQLPQLTAEEKEQFFYFLDTPDQILADWIYANQLPEGAVAKRFVLELREVKK